jgi:hypothetical protein
VQFHSSFTCFTYDVPCLHIYTINLAGVILQATVAQLQANQEAQARAHDQNLVALPQHYYQNLATLTQHYQRQISDLTGYFQSQILGT